MRENWANAIKLLLESEGPELNVSSGEPGGASKYGVSVTAYSEYRRTRVTVGVVGALTAQEAEVFYYNTTAKACRFDYLPLGVDYVMLDITANLGNSGGPRLLQLVLGTWPLINSWVDDATLAKAKGHDQRELIVALGSAWLAFHYGNAGAWLRSGHGWTNRMMRVREQALGMLR